MVEIFESRISLTICVDSVSGNCEAPLGSNPRISTSEKDKPKTNKVNCIIVRTLVTVRYYTWRRTPLLASADSCLFRAHCCN